MLRLVFCALHLLLAVAFSMPGCANRGQAPVQPVEEPGLPIGSAAPEIAGEDVDGAFCKLSDYRGKVVLLDFWGNW